MLHQVYVWFCWRTQLHSSLIARALGPKAFNYYAAGFIFFMLLRGSMILLLAIANRNTLDIDRLLLSSLAVIIAIPVLYVHYSVMRYFGFRRAMGIDHFDPSYRGAPLVKKGIFRFTNNAIYTYGLLILWIPGLVFGSRTALLAALFHHIYIWIHYYTTEKPDMERIYGAAKNNRSA
ncbi:MAG: methyltransferase [Chloroflexota bacterium]